jgi:hypothetical protein
MKNKKMVKKLKLKENVKNALVIACSIVIMFTCLLIMSNRIENIEDNPKAYDNRSISVNVHPNYK